MTPIQDASPPRQTAIVDGIERFAIFTGWNGVACDAPGCTHKINTERDHYDGRRARAEAAAKGWVYADGKDLCPEHAAAPPARDNTAQ